MVLFRKPQSSHVFSRVSVSVSIGEQCMHQHRFTPSQVSSGSLSSSTGWACVSAAAALVGASSFMFFSSSSLYSSLYMQPHASVFTKKKKQNNKIKQTFKTFLHQLKICLLPRSYTNFTWSCSVHFCLHSEM